MLTGIRLPPGHTTYNIEEEDEGEKKKDSVFRHRKTKRKLGVSAHRNSYTANKNLLRFL